MAVRIGRPAAFGSAVARPLPDHDDEPVASAQLEVALHDCAAATAVAAAGRAGNPDGVGAADRDNPPPVKRAAGADVGGAL